MAGIEKVTDNVHQCVSELKIANYSVEFSHETGLRLDVVFVILLKVKLQNGAFILSRIHYED